MPDEPTESKVEPSDSGKGATPAIDYEALGAAIAPQIAAGVKEALKDQPRETQAVQDPIADLIRPHVDSAVQSAKLIAEAAADKADFYSGADVSGDAVDEMGDRREWRTEVEKTFDWHVKNGRPMTRLSIWENIKGRNLDKFVEKTNTRKQTKLDRVAQVQDAGGGLRPDQSPNSPKGDPHDWDDDTLNKVASGMSF